MLALRRRISLPMALLLLVSFLSVCARVAWLDYPCQGPCTKPTQHLLIFDEVYYVNAARVIDGINPPANNHYTSNPLGDDPNAEHPQLVKLIIAGSIKLFGDGPLAWRLGSLIAGTLAIFGMWALARAAGAGEWLAFGAGALMSADNLMLVMGRIGTLDIYAVAAMVWAVALYLRRRPLLAGIVLGIGTACKEVAPYALIVVVLYEIFQAFGKRPAPRELVRTAGRIGLFTLVTAGVFIGLLAAMDKIAPPYDSASAQLVTGGVFGHIWHIITYGRNLTSPHGPHGIASYPWEWLVDYKPIVYLSIVPGRPGPGLINDHPQVMFLGMISPPIMLLAMPAMALAAFGVWRTRRRFGISGVVGSQTWTPPRLTQGTAGPLGLAWFIGTWLPFELFSLLFARTSYLYYMVIVMPGIYLAVSALVVAFRRRRWLVGIWVVTVLAAVVVMYPFMPIHW
jgi:4-amino-4-deoxy-L-arabinose transferase-like glycosyltransferase